MTFNLFETDWEKMNPVRLVNQIVNMSENFEWGGIIPSEEDIRLYEAMYRRAKEIGSDSYKLAGCVRPEFYGKKNTTGNIF